ncbi:cation diffusion facilitator family transporter [Paludicola sp. MB14-C6]|uniref:cation diffusion facilitator family transporter n=1 Tax=Paludihabitans sp. MB14-C6 TaxID=3070656 RepID=UPI0027DC4D95|nr:cation diffusion facilitator family transporter [Paludicola sp. MB14-C6]WMJ22952.1 cation diffusion facilitator family transporter [Paludicola sp. MB14-C6]
MTKLLTRLFIKNYKEIHNMQVRQNYGLLASIVGIICNIFLCTIKFIAGLLTSSIAITADAFNNLSDAGSSIVSLLGFKISGSPADDDHPFGHGRMEYVAGLIVAMIIILMGFELGKTSLEKIFHPEPIAISILSFSILIIAILMKLWMYFFNLKISKAIGSIALKATAMDSLSDIIATSTVAISMIISFFTGFNLDSYAGIVVAAFILYTGFNTARETLNPLLGEAPTSEFVKAIEDKVLSYNGVVGTHDLIVHNYGPNRTIVSLHAEVPCNIDIMSIHDTIDNIERDIKKEFGCEAVIHMDPIVVNDSVSNAMKIKVLAMVKLIDASIELHDFRMIEGPTHTNLIFDIVVPHKFRMTDKQIIESIANAVKVLDNTLEVVINVDKAYISK